MAPPARASEAPIASFMAFTNRSKRCTASWGPGDASGWNENELTLIEAANEMYRDTMISDDTWAALSESYDTHQLMSIAWTVARYRRVAMVLNALGVQPLPTDERLPMLEGY